MRRGWVLALALARRGLARPLPIAPNTANAAAQPAVPISAPNTGGTIPAVNS